MVKLVRVKPECVTTDDESTALQRLEEHGYLWFETDEEPRKYSNGTMRNYRSLATGYGYEWYDHEVEEAGAAEAAGRDEEQPE